MTGVVHVLVHQAKLPGELQVRTDYFFNPAMQLRESLCHLQSECNAGMSAGFLFGTLDMGEGMSFQLEQQRCNKEGQVAQSVHLLMPVS